MPAGGGKPSWAGIAHHERFSLIQGFAGNLLKYILKNRVAHSAQTQHYRIEQHPNFYHYKSNPYKKLPKTEILSSF
ncbi:hypothetical protein E6P74_12190 [Moraxella lacunata]|uniref:hypothetical protein n=1 Tax=Moraxella lacunata TaxID=477 RepID=UPI0024A72A10|nr:hypothetical protein [Moraxella lacunata]MDI4484055.1 hypothetical protein [Moraxella lacunata]MDI4506560.1 hypothetical protein [Moraxella lacunata]